MRSQQKMAFNKRKIYKYPQLDKLHFKENSYVGSDELRLTGLKSADFSLTFLQSRDDSDAPDQSVR